jgi:uncharacterized membrane protein
LLIGAGLGGFWAALLLCALGVFIGHHINLSQTQPSPPTEPWQAAKKSDSEQVQSEEIPDFTDSQQSRIYITRLAARVHALESQVAALKGEPATAKPATTVASKSASPSEVSTTPGSPPIQPYSEPAQDLPLTPHPSSPTEVPQETDAIPSVAESSVEPPPEQVTVDESAGKTTAKKPATVPTDEKLVPLMAKSDTGLSLLSRLISGNIVGKVGIVVLFFGVGFLLKFAYDYGLMPPEIRLIGVAISAAILFKFGWELIETRWLYGLILQGGASGLVYIDVFFALKTYGFISATLGFGLFFALGVATTLLAVRQNAKPLAMLGLMGAFLAPILASTGGGNHILLFSYYTLINLFIVAVSWFKAWRELNLTGWAFTFPIAFAWGWSNYQPELFPTVEPFLLIFFGIYLIIPILFATRQMPELKGLVDGTLVFGTPAVAAFMQSRLVEGMPYGLAWSAAVACVLYGVLAFLVIRRKNMRLLGETFCALSVGFGTLAIFYAFGAYTTFALWSIEGAAILWVGLRQGTRLARLFGLFVQTAGALYFFRDFDHYDRISPFFNDAILGCAIITVASTISAALMHRYKDHVSAMERTLGTVFLVWGALWWSLGGLDAIHHGASHEVQPAIALLFFSATVAAAEHAGVRSSWGALRGLSAAHPIILLLTVFAQIGAGSEHPLADNGWLAWPVGLSIFFWTIHRQRRDGFQFATDVRYIAGWLILAGVATWEASWLLSEKLYFYGMLLAMAAYAAGYLRFHLHERGRRDVIAASGILVFWATFLWFASGLGWIHEQLPNVRAIVAALTFVGSSCVAYELVARGLGWRALRLAALTVWVAMPLALGMQTLHATHPLSDWGWTAWPFVWSCAIFGLYREELDGNRVLSESRHALALWLPIILLTWELHYWTDTWHLGHAWRTAALALPSTIALIVILQPICKSNWPLELWWPLYRDILLSPIACAIGFWTIYANIKEPGLMTPLPYLPLLNPLDLMIAAALFTFIRWRGTLNNRDATSVLDNALATAGFIWLNAIALRSIHFWADVPYRLDRLLDDVLVQATLSILWTSTALVLMILARRNMKRQFWLIGAGLLGVVVLKLFLVDLANTGTIARIVSFLVVGILLLIIGYAAPVPPGEKEAGLENIVT